MNFTHTVIYQDPNDPKNLLQEKVITAKAEEAKTKMGTMQGIYLGAAYIRGSFITKIQMIQDTSHMLGAENGRFCSQCEKGFIFTPDKNPIYGNSASACSCNIAGAEAIRAYMAILGTQSWHK